MKEGSGWHNSQMRTLTDKHEMMRVLADVNTVLIRALYNKEQIQSRLPVLIPMFFTSFKVYKI